MSMSTTEFDWQSVYDRLAGVRDDEIRDDALMIAYKLWCHERTLERGASYGISNLCYRAVRLARRRAKRHERIDVNSAAVEHAAARQPVETLHVDCDWSSLTDRQRLIAARLAEGAQRNEIAAEIGVHPGQVSREIERMAQFFAVAAH